MLAGITCVNGASELPHRIERRGKVADRRKHGVRERPSASAAQMELAAPRVDHRKTEIHSSVGKFSQNLHVGNILVETEKKRLQPRAEYPRLLAYRRPSARPPDVIQRYFVLQ